VEGGRAIADAFTTNFALQQMFGIDGVEPYLQRNRRVRQRTAQMTWLFLWIAKLPPWERGSLSPLGRDMIGLIARSVWNTRADAAWV